MHYLFALLLFWAAIAWLLPHSCFFEPPKGHSREKVFRISSLRWSDKERDYG